ncbi:MAG: hypothetical protein ACI8RZ_003955 [Myxococcota bacterium]|jgi:hypothetical protein
MKMEHTVIGMMWVLGCSGGDEDVTYYEDVKPILDGRCVNCHQDGGVAPFVLDAYADAAPLADAIASNTTARTMPPWGAVEGHQGYNDDPSLSAEQLDTLTAWAEQGALEGDAATEGAPLTPVGQSLARIDITLEMPEPYTPSNDQPDDYRCFVLDWPEDTEQYVTAFNVLPGNDEVVHHVAAFLVAPDGLLGDSIFETIAGWDASEDGPGYSCYGGPSSSNGESAQIPIEQLAQWVPGFGAQEFSEGTGILIPPGSQIILQLHYNVAGGVGEDQTAIEFTLEDTVARRAQFAPVLDATWPLSGMDIPAGQVTTHDVQFDPRAFFALLSGDALNLDDGFDIHSILLHMHKLGEHGMVSVERADGSSEVLLEVSPYDFNWQLNYRLSQAVPFADGDEIRLTCTFDNSEGSADLSWGEGSEEEMCVANLFISEL